MASYFLFFVAFLAVRVFFFAVFFFAAGMLYLLVSERNVPGSAPYHNVLTESKINSHDLSGVGDPDRESALERSMPAFGSSN